MLINSDEINKILAIAGDEVTKRAKKYFETSKVRVSDFNYKSDTNYYIKIYVEGNYVYDVTVKKENAKLAYTCNCPGYSKKTTPCKHIVAAIFDMYINYENYMDSLKENESKKIEETTINISVQNEKISYKNQSEEILSYYERLENFKRKEDLDIEVIPVLNLSNMNKDLNLSFKIGKEKLYNIRDIYKFAERIKNNEEYKYGKDLEFTHNILAFNEDSKKMVKFISKKINEYLEFSKINNVNINKNLKEYIVLRAGTLDDFFSLILKDIEINDYDYEKCFGMISFSKENPKIEFEIIEDEESIYVIKSNEEYYIFKGEEYSYILYKNTLHRCDKLYIERMIPLLLEYKNKDTDKIVISKKRGDFLFEYIVPYINEMSKLLVNEELTEKYKVEKLVTKIYLDINKNLEIEAEVRFCYGKEMFNPFSKEDENVFKNNRNIIQETKVKEIFNSYKFLVNYKNKIMYLKNEEDIYNFLNEGIDLFNKNFEVNVTDKLKSKQINIPKSIQFGVKIKNNLLEIDVENLDFNEIELKEIFKKYKEKKKYFRLKDGSYINLETLGLDTLSKIKDDFLLTEKMISDKKVIVPKYRAFYLEELLSKNDIKIKVENGFQKIIEDLEKVERLEFKIPTKFENVLRPYQKVGFNWLKTLKEYGFGGILADDMGLGKTIQVISILEDEKKISGKTSIVICPSSLYINWEKEITKFAPDLNVLVVSGSYDERTNLIKEINNYDVLITSYDLLKRDIEKYEDYTFKYIISDEAQYIKNNNTKNAYSLKKLKGESKFALTGTPIENSLSELWSIFDYIMPGYLYSYKRFKAEFETPIIKDEDKVAMQKLQLLVKPFVLRRTKKEVLKELPDKTESIMYSQMDEIQNKLYKSYLQKAKEKLTEEISKNGYEKSQMKILSVITRLRQICCHPALFIDNYEGESSKLNQCMEILNEAICAGHKVLIFSQFTSMLDILKKKLDEKDITHYVLTGKTKISERSELVEKFNKDKNINVFLISLKAGGTGLNLTGADMVIHYDPWWNLSVQNQATDRAYRIGQKSNVQVFKLITKNSIEEKINELQQKKQNLTDSVIKEGETFITKLTKEDIMNLFEN